MNSPHLSLVERRPRQEPRLAVRISSFAGSGGPYGRSRTFRLTEAYLEELIEHAERLENRRRR
jgi:hypothetical protein